MVNIIVQEDCGNAPKKAFLRDFIVAVVKGDNTFISGSTTDDICWNYVGNGCFNGKHDALAALKRLRSDEIRELVIHTIITHGYHGCVEGALKFADGKMLAFCDVYQFRASTNNAPIKAIRTYAIING